MSLVNLKINNEENDGNEAVLVKWLKIENDYVTENEAIAIVETNKVTLEIVTPVSGVLIKKNVTAGEYFDSDEVLGTVKPSSKNIVDINQENTSHVNSQPEVKTNISPAAKALMKKNNISENDITIKHGKSRISKEDVNQYLNRNNTTENHEFSIIELSHKQTVAARKINESLSEAPHVTTFFEADMSAILQHKNKPSTENTNINLTAYYTHALIKTLKHFPELNRHYEKNQLKTFNKINLGVVTSLENDDIIVPILMNIGDSTLNNCADRINDLSKRARENKLKPEDLNNGTISISNYGASGSLFASPIVIVRPQVAIIGVGKIQQKPVAIKNKSGYEILIKPISYISLTIDHRVINGSQANRFMTALCENIENYS